MKIIPYNRKINAPIRFLYYLEVFDLFVIMVLGFFLPLGAASFLPVDVPLWHVAIWLVILTVLLIMIKIGRAPGFIQHWLTQLTKPKSFHPGKKNVEYFVITPQVYQAEKYMAQHPQNPIAPDELLEIQTSVRKLQQERRERQMLHAGI